MRDNILACIADLERQQELIAAAVESLRALVYHYPPPVTQDTPVAATVKAPPRQAKPIDKIAEDRELTVAEAQGLYNKGERLSAIATAVGKPLATVQAWSSRYKWREKRDAIGRRAAPEAPPVAGSSGIGLGGPCEWVYPNSPGVWCESVSKFMHEGKRYCGNHNPERHTRRMVQPSQPSQRIVEDIIDPPAPFSPPELRLHSSTGETEQDDYSLESTEDERAQLERCERLLAERDAESQLGGTFRCPKCNGKSADRRGHSTCLAPLQGERKA